MATPPMPDDLETLVPEPWTGREFEADPAPFLERLRAAHGPVAPVELMGVRLWMVLDYRESLEILQDETAWRKDMSHWRAMTQGRVPRDWSLLSTGLTRRSMMSYDGEEHRQASIVLDRAIRPFQHPTHPRARALREAVARIADELLDLMTEGGDGTGTADLCAQYTRPLPVMVVGRLFGFPADLDDELLMDVWRALDGSTDTVAAAERLIAAMERLVERKKAEPGDDLVSGLLAASPGLPAAQLAVELYQVLSVGADSTGNLIANTVLEVLRGNAGACAALASGRTGEAVNHAAIACPPIGALPLRFAVSDVPVGRYVIAAGDPVAVSVVAAHRDPAFAGRLAADALHSTRAHLAWGAGQHQCPARDLAGSIVSIALERLFARFSRLEPVEPLDELPWRATLSVRSLRALVVRYELAPVRPGGEGREVTQEADSVAQAPRPERPRTGLRRLLEALRRRVG
ncbi:cytochrome P450 [Streptomyces thermolineatus]|uniref:Cytochrome P450 n=1 Tax=Streptomyces thermolineatus TaxID=44033 RepID=A0ABP5YTU9_9ACTN